MKGKYTRDWSKFVESTSEFLTDNIHKSRVSLKYRNKAPSRGILNVTNDNRSFRYKFTEKNDLDKLDDYLKSLLHMLANKQIEGGEPLDVNKVKESKKKIKKSKKH